MTDQKPLSLRRSDLETASGRPPENDYDVMCEGKVVGRIYKTERYEPVEWFWGNYREPNSAEDRGFAPSLEAAKAAFKKAWER